MAMASRARMAAYTQLKPGVVVALFMVLVLVSDFVLSVVFRTGTGFVKAVSSGLIFGHWTNHKYYPCDDQEEEQDYFDDDIGRIDDEVVVVWTGFEQEPWSQLRNREPEPPVWMTITVYLLDEGLIEQLDLRLRRHGLKKDVVDIEPQYSGSVLGVYNKRDDWLLMGP
ncbi:hypothetical protein PanWU01x14_213230 [Parasponia andersonii]|uniref:Uncharacterized protein n=1 Tax=Parasponia andersonii TaxID=3476 RepID=A0A2P5BT27_PARAD|nr:hypothetical protein PanWU01x14_213230 [Parasponia andersonii]